MNEMNVFIGALTALILGIVISATSYNAHKNHVMAEVIKNGSSPVEVMCSFDDPRSDSPVCVLYVSNISADK